MVLAYLLAARTLIPLEFVWSWRESVDTTWTTLRSASKISSALVFTFIIVLRICNTVLRLNMMFLFLPFSTFKKMKLFTFVCCSLWSILSREFFLTTSNESFWMELIRSSSNQRSTIWSSRTSQRSKMGITDLVWTDLVADSQHRYERVN